MSKQDRQATIRAALQWAARYLEEKGIVEPRLDADLLLAYCLRLTRVELYLEPTRALSLSEQAGFTKLVERRGLREPVPYITGVQEFMALEFAVSKDVLIPRADTEALVETALNWARQEQGPLRLLDLCTGSGVVAVCLAHYLPQAEVWAGDISVAALSIARANASRHNAKVHFRQGDLLEPFTGQAPFRLVTANPPYIPGGEIEGLEPEVSFAEPRLALDGGPDGLDFYRRIAAEVQAVLVPGGKLMLEIGWDQYEGVREILLGAGFLEIGLVQDYAGRDRVVTATAP